VWFSQLPWGRKETNNRGQVSAAYKNLSEVMYLQKIQAIIFIVTTYGIRKEEEYALSQCE